MHFPKVPIPGNSHEIVQEGIIYLCYKEASGVFVTIQKPRCSNKLPFHALSLNREGNYPSQHAVSIEKRGRTKKLSVIGLINSVRYVFFTYGRKLLLPGAPFYQHGLSFISVWTSNGSWCIGIKGEMSGTVCVTFSWDIYVYIWVVYSFCLFCCLFNIVTWWYMWCIVWQVASKRKYRHVW